MTPVETLRTGEVGYVATGLKNLADSQVGDTITNVGTPAARPLVGYRPAKPMVFAGLYPIESNDYQGLRDALGKLGLNDASCSSSQKPQTPLDSDSVADSSGYCTWRSFVRGWSASLGSTY